MFKIRDFTFFRHKITIIKHNFTKNSDFRRSALAKIKNKT
jgi:hypothetical protein